MILRDYQEAAVTTLLGAVRGIIKAPAGSGKTIIGAAAAFRLRRPASFKLLWLANTTEQCDQARAALKAVGFPGVQADVMCYQSGQSASGYDLVILDEAHHIASPEFRKCLDGFVGIRWGLSATPDRADHLKDDVYQLIGPIVYTIEREGLVADGRLASAKVYFHAPNDEEEFVSAIETDAEARAEKMQKYLAHTALEMQRKSVEQVTRLLGTETYRKAILIAEAYDYDVEGSVSGLRAACGNEEHTALIRQWLLGAAKIELLSRARWQACQEQGVFQNRLRNANIVRLAHRHKEDSVLILVGSIEHGNYLKEGIPDSLVIFSKMGAKKRREAMAAFKDGSLKCAIATSLADEGLDVPRANVLILAAAGRSAAKAEQRTGRVLRSWSDKTHGTIHDFWDRQHPLLLNQSRARAKVYAGLQYEFVGMPEVLPIVLKAVGISLHPAIGMEPKKKTSKKISEKIQKPVAGSINPDEVRVPSTSEVESPEAPVTTTTAPNEHDRTDPIHASSSQVGATVLAPAGDGGAALLHATRAHAPLSPSKLKAKAICPGFENDDSRPKDAANRGSLGHEAVEKMNLDLCGDDTQLRHAAERCIVYKRKLTKGREFLQEIKLPYCDNQWGYCDLLAFDGPTRADLADWKFAWNFYEANTPQFHAYAIGIWDLWPLIEEITIHTVHPFLNAVDIEKFTRKEHYEKFLLGIKAIIAQARIRDPEHFRITNQCTYCGFAGQCAKLANMGFEIGKRYADDLEVPAGPLHGSQVTDPVAMAMLQKLAPIMDTALGGWRKAGLTMADNGTEVPGYEIGHRSGKRNICSANAAFAIVKEHFAKAISIEEFLTHCDVTATGLDELVKAASPDGQKAKNVILLQAHLEDADALTTGAGSRFLRQIKKKA